MTVNPFNHIDLRVSNMAEAMRFYASLLPLLGFTHERHGAPWKVFSAEGKFPSVPYFGFTEQPDHRPNATRIAFWVGSAQEVDKLAEVIRTAGGRNVSGPKACPEYSSTYYAVFFLKIRAATGSRYAFARTEAAARGQSGPDERFHGRAAV